MIRTIALDDEPLALDIIQRFCNRFDWIRFEAGFTSVAEARAYLRKQPVDLIFLDIQMPAESGMSFYQSLDTKPLLVFTTSFSEYALESYELDAVDYLLKPFTVDRFEKAVRKADEILKQRAMAASAGEGAHLMLKVGYELVKVFINDILFIQGLDNYLKIHIRNQAPIVVRMTFKTLTDKLPFPPFLRVHRSYVIAADKVDSIRPKSIFIGGEDIPIGKSFENELRERFKHS